MSELTRIFSLPRQTGSTTPRGLDTMNRSPRTFEGTERGSVAGGFGSTPPVFCHPGVGAPATASIATFTTVLSEPPQQLAEATPQRPGLEPNTRPIALSTQSCDWIRSLFPSLLYLKLSSPHKYNCPDNSVASTQEIHHDARRETRRSRKFGRP